MMGFIRQNMPKYLSITISIIVILAVQACAPAIVEELIQEFPQQGAQQSNFFEGPHLVYDNDSVTVLWGEALNQQMDLKVNRYSTTELGRVQVYKSGFLARDFDVNLKDTIHIEATHYPMADSIFAVSDIEGNFNTLINLLQQNKVIDEHLNWMFGNGHFVLIGDIFDRGNHVTEMLWFLYGLEEQAQAYHGHVHILLGNHEALNLKGDLRYVEPKYTTFADLTTTQYGISHTDLFGSDSELGRWLRSKNVVEKIGDNIFVHAGLSPEMLQSGYSLEEINKLARNSLGKAKTDYTEVDRFIQGKTGPFWYRGYFDVNIKSWGPRATQTEVDNILNHFGGDLVVVGHTHVSQPELRYSGKVCAINVVQPADHLVYVPPVHSFGVFIRESTIFRADENGIHTQLILE